MKINPSPEDNLPPVAITISAKHARRFLLAHQRLLPPRNLSGKTGILAYTNQVGCIQFDPINVVGRNPDLVLQSRIKNYRPEMLEDLLYGDRRLFDGWDKVQSIYPVTDWPNFARLRAHISQRRGNPDNPAMKIAPEVIEKIRQQGPMSSIDFKANQRIEWTWGQSTQVARACLETLYEMGVLGIHHRVHTRRVFDLIENLLPDEILCGEDQNMTLEEYQDWHVLRRVGGLGLANASGTEHWLGMLGVDGEMRRKILKRLNAVGELLPVHIEEIPKRTFYIRQVDMPTFQMVQTKRMPNREAAVIAPLDNLIWDRSLIRWLFDFDYIWEIYKPKNIRKYGYYVLPVLYGDRFVARFEPAFDKKTRLLTVINWWWEAEVKVDGQMKKALSNCFLQFMANLGAQGLVLGEQISGALQLGWLRQIA